MFLTIWNNPDYQDQLAYIPQNLCCLLINKHLHSLRIWVLLTVKQCAGVIPAGCPSEWCTPLFTASVIVMNCSRIHCRLVHQHTEERRSSGRQTEAVYTLIIKIALLRHISHLEARSHFSLRFCHLARLHHFACSHLDEECPDPTADAVVIKGPGSSDKAK